MPDKNQAAAREIFGVRVGSISIMTHSLSISSRPWIPSSQRHFSFQPLGLFFYLLSGQMAVGRLGTCRETPHPWALLPGGGIKEQNKKTAKKLEKWSIST